MDKYEVRRKNLEKIKNAYCGGSQTELARRIGRRPSYVSRMLSEPGSSGHRRIADDMVDIITNAFNLPLTWLDGINNHSSAATDCTVAKINLEASFKQNGEAEMVNNEYLGELYIPASFGVVDVIKVSGEGLFPRIKHGEAIVLSRDAIPSPGDDVAIWLKDSDTFMIKTITADRGAHYQVFDVNSAARPETIAKDNIKNIQVIAAIFRDTFSVI
ncbi:XRE family transcriptional regulator [Vibrio navarrensis]|uniref:XRE family transcriptional regulator n=1 Tax=Vibrio navarrensis TaxID=29495 RepID=UPI00155977E2|nr:LexA family transcriptional regulator [Vibrio navarrensis]